MQETFHVEISYFSAHDGQHDVNILPLLQAEGLATPGTARGGVGRRGQDQQQSEKSRAYAANLNASVGWASN